MASREGAQFVVVGTFVKDPRIVFGTIVATLNGAVVWAGPVAQCPLDDFSPGTMLNMHPKLYSEIERRVQQVEEGIHVDQPST